MDIIKSLFSGVIGRWLDKVQRYFGRKIQKVISESMSHGNSIQVLQMNMGRLACWQLENKTTLNQLADAEFQVFSQWGEDGILEWLIQNLPISNKSFVEFGVENFTEANTRYLLLNRNWKGLIFDGNPNFMDAVRREPLYWKHDLTAECAFITKDNINDLIFRNGFSGEIGLLSIDIDGNDYWVWKNIDCVSPLIVVCEYNPIFGDQYQLTVPYRADFNRFDSHFSGLYFGASISALKSLASRKGYKFVGTNSNGINAFFVRQDLYPIVGKKIGEIKEYPSRHRDSRDRDGSLSFVGGRSRSELIKNMPVTLLSENRDVEFGSLSDIYSDAWLAEM